MNETSNEYNTEVVVVGGGQSGVAMSEHLTDLAIPHVVLERGRIAERWRSERWDSLVTNAPAWHDRFPGLEHTVVGPDEFVPKDDIADYMSRYARLFDAPIKEGVTVNKVTRNAGNRGFTVDTTDGTYNAHYIVSATGPFQTHVIPQIMPADAPVHQIHSADYKNPQDLPEGGVLVVGAGSSGAQIAAELNAAGRDTYLAVGAHERPPRNYRNRDFCWWMGVLDMWDQTEGAHVTIAVSGADGGKTVDFRELAARGMTLTGRVSSYADGSLVLANDLAENLRQGDKSLLEFLHAADEYVTANGLSLPEEPELHHIGELPTAATEPLRELDLAATGIKTIIWATGFGRDYSWLDVPGALDDNGSPAHARGTSKAHGVYFMGLPWQSRRGSSFIWGCWHDARFIADQIRIQRNYHRYSHPQDQEPSVGHKA